MSKMYPKGVLMQITKNINDNSIKYSSGLQSIEAIIGDIASAINEPVSHKCKKVIRYMQAFFLDLFRAITSFEEFVSFLVDAESELHLYEILKFQIPILSVINIQNLVKLQPIYIDDMTSNLLV
ncbi:hypothetical protein HDR58_03065 [bacterium]|nr:hypothetical protein [bacterium]